MKIVLFWDYWGHHHWARFKAFRSHSARIGFDVFGLSLADSSSTYAWLNSNDENRGVFKTLFPGQVAENISRWRLTLRLARYLSDERPDVIFVPGYWPAYTLIAALLSRILGVKVVLMCDTHLGTEKAKSRIVAFLKQLIMHLYGSTFVGGKATRRYLAGLGFDRLYMLDGCDVVDNNFFDKKKGGGPSSHPPYILFLGRLVWEKNLNFLIRSYFRAINKGLVGIELHIVGSGPDKDSIVLSAIKSGIQVVDVDCAESISVNNSGGVVRFIPFVQVSDIPRIMGLSEALILPSISETWGLVVNESMATGCPVICSSAVGCVDDLVLNGVTGLVFSPDNEDELADHIINIVSNRTLRAGLINGGKRMIHSWGLSRFSSNATKLAVHSIRLDAPVLGVV